MNNYQNNWKRLNNFKLNDEFVKKYGENKICESTSLDTSLEKPIVYIPLMIIFSISTYYWIKRGAPL